MRTTSLLKAGPADDLANGDQPQNSIRITGNLSTTSADTAGELARILFDEGANRSFHKEWRALISRPEFDHNTTLTHDERVGASYRRLRLLNNAVGHAEELANAPHLLSSLHEWTSLVDGGLTAIAGIHYNLFLGSILDHDCAQRDLAPFTELRETGTFLCTELDHGNDVASIETTATLDRRTGGFILDTPTVGAQKFMPNTCHAGGPKSAVVAARLVVDGAAQGVFLFLVKLSDECGHLPGIRVRPLPHRAGAPIDHALTAFDQVRLPREALLEGDHGRLSTDGTLVSAVGSPRKRLLRAIGRVTTGKLCMSATALGMTRLALTIAVRYAHSRQIAGPRAGDRIPVVRHRTHHAPLVHALATAYAMTFLHRSVVDRWARRDDDTVEELERLAAVAKGWITWQARDIAIECRERCGAQGLFPSNLLTELALNIEGAITAEGDNLVIWAKAAAEMVFGHRPADPCRPAAATGGGLADPWFLRGLLAAVEGVWQRRARAALRSGPSGDSLGRWNAASGAALEMVSAFVVGEAGEKFLAAVDRVVDPVARGALRRLCCLFLLQGVSEHADVLLTTGRLTVDEVIALPQAVDDAVADLVSFLPDLVGGFGVPPEVLSGVPIACDDRGDEGLRG